MKTTKIVGVASSANINGSSSTLLREALAGAESAGSAVEEIQLVRLRLNFCKGCLRCMREGRCCQHDDFETVRNAVENADGVILSTPTYAAAPCAVMKNLIDRLGLFEYMTSSAFGGRYLAVLATAKSFGADKASKYLADVATGGVFGSARLVGRMAAILRGGKTAAQLPSILARARALGVKMAKDIQRGKTYPFQNVFPRMVNALIMKPVISQGIVQYREQGMGGVYENLKRRHLIA